MRSPTAHGLSTDVPTDARPLSPSETAWALAGPAAAVAIGVALLAATALGDVLFSLATDRSAYFPSARPTLAPKPDELARFLIAVASAIAFAGIVVLVARKPPRMRGNRPALLAFAVQCLCVALMAYFWIKQRDVEVEATRRVYFTLQTVAVAMLLTVGASIVLVRERVLRRLLGIPSNRVVRWACALVAVAVTAIWLLPSIYSDANIALAPDGITKHVEFTFDESISVLNGRSPLVDMTTYGALIPYLIALPLSGLGATLIAFMTIMSMLTALAMLAVYALLHRLTRHALAALALFVPFLATSFFWVNGTFDARYEFGNYFAMFPIRYGGPYLLAWMVTRQLDGSWPRRPVVLFALAGLVVLNNTDFGLPAFAATFAAILCARPPTSTAAFLRLCRSAVIGVAIAVGLVTILTLMRTGSAPQLERLFAYARLFGTSGFSNLPTPLLGLHLVIYTTFVAALVTAVVRSTRGALRTSLTGMLAWSGIFGLGTGAYYMYRSHPDVLIALFSSWTLALALLVIAIAPAVVHRRPRRLMPADLGVLLAFGLAVCSIAQFPPPWRQIERIELRGPERPLEWREVQRLVKAHTRPREHVALLMPLGHRVAYESGVVNVAAYTGLLQMPTFRQLDETLRALRTEGGDTVFVDALSYWQEVIPLLRRAGFRLATTDERTGFTVMVDRRAGDSA